MYQGLKGLGLPGLDDTSGTPAGPPGAGPGSSDDDSMGLDTKDIKEKDIKVDEVIKDLQNNHVYVEGLGFIPKVGKGLMSQM